MAKTKAIPNTMLGMKVPDALRNSDALNAVIASPLARQILADALIAGAAAAAAVIAGKRSKRGAAKDMMQHVVGTAAGVMTAAMEGATKRSRAPAALLEAPARERSGRGAARTKSAKGRGHRRSGASRKPASRG